MDGLIATLLLTGAGICAVAAMAAAKRLRIDAMIERAASTPTWRVFGRGLAMAGWMMLASIGVVTVGFAPSAWLTSPQGATWFAVTLLGSLAVVAWSRSVLQVNAATNTTTLSRAVDSQSRKAA